MELRPAREESNRVRFGWREILQDYWLLVVSDLMEIYGVDLYAPDCQTTWLGLRQMIRGLTYNPRSRAWTAASDG